MRTTLISLILSAVSVSSIASAQTAVIPKDDTLKGAGDEDVEGWSPVLGLAGTLNLVSNSSVVGQVDGTSLLVGLGVSGGADYVKGKDVIRTTLSIAESVARTPVIDEFVKTNDVVAIEGIYNRFLNKKLGLFGRLNIQTSLFPATDIRGEATTWVRKNDMTTLATDAFRLRLADPLHPFTIGQSAGVFFDPKRSDKFSLSLRFGAGGRETFASGVLLIDDDKATDEIELLALNNVYQLGAEAFAGATGKLRDGRLTYRAGLAVLIPFVNNDKDDRSAFALTRVALEGNLTFNVFEWMSLVYSITVTKDPQLFPEGSELTQIQNNLLLTFTYSLVEKKKKAKEPTAAEKELADTKARAEAAETRVKELETSLATCPTNCPTTPPAAPAPDPAPAPATPAPATPAPATP